jgi:hypothetical protein
MEYKILSRCSEEAASGPVPNQTRPVDILKYNTYKIRVYIILAHASALQTF